MIKPNSCIYFVPLFPLFNEKETRLFESFDSKNSSYLYSSLYLNYKELSDKLLNSADVVYCFDQADKDHIPQDFFDSQKVFLNLNDKLLLFRVLSEKYFDRFKNNLIIFTNTIKISVQDILKYLDLLNREDDSVVIGKSEKGKLTYIGFNVYNSELFSQLSFTDLKFDNFLHLVCRYDYFINVLDQSLFIEDLDDFRNLYNELSKKESLNYCSQNIHEKFTHLFIEYKELLKC